jgi:hypothetical protein
MFKKMMGEETEPSHAIPAAPSQRGISKQAASDILGVDVTAQPDDIRMAHKR